MNIEIGKYKITSDEYNITLMEKYINSDGQELYRQISFFHSLESACRYILDREIQLSDSVSISNLINTITDCKREIAEAVNTLSNGQK